MATYLDFGVTELSSPNAVAAFGRLLDGSITPNPCHPAWIAARLRPPCGHLESGRVFGRTFPTTVSTLTNGKEKLFGQRLKYRSAFTDLGEGGRQVPHMEEGNALNGLLGS